MEIKHLFFDLDRTLWDFEKNSQNELNYLFNQYKLHQRGISLPNEFINPDEFIDTEREIALEILFTRHARKNDCVSGIKYVKNQLKNDTNNIVLSYEIGRMCYNHQPDLALLLGNVAYKMEIWGEALEYYEDACRTDKFLACEKYGFMFYENKLPASYKRWREDRKLERSLQYIEISSKNEFPESMVLFATFLHNGTIKDSEMQKEKRIENARELYRKAITKGSVNAMYAFPIWGLNEVTVWFNKNFRNELCGYLAKAINLDPNHMNVEIARNLNKSKCS